MNSDPNYAPDWDRWREVETLSPREGAMLSCNVDPEHPDLHPGTFEDSIGHEVASRIDIARRHFRGAKFTGAISISEFALWALGRWENVPSEFEALARGSVDRAGPGHKERQTYLKIIGAFAEKHGVHLEPVSQGVAAIEAMTREAGLTLSDKTVRKVVHEVSVLLKKRGPRPTKKVASVGDLNKLTRP